MKSNSIFKRILCAILVGVMLFAFAGCSEEEEGGIKTLKFAVNYANQRDTKVVEAALNKKLETLLPGVQIELIEIPVEQWNMWMSSNQRVDIAWTGYSFDMSEQIRMGSYQKLDDLIAKYAPNIQKEMELYIRDYESARYTDGSLYAIPNQQPFISETPYLIIPEPAYQYFNVEAFLAETAKSPYTTREIYEILDDYFEALVANGVTNTDYVGKYLEMGYVDGYLAYRGYQLMGNDIVYKVWNDDGTVVENPVFQHKTETDAYKLWMEYAQQWHKKGYIAPSMTDSGVSGTQMPTLSGHDNGMWNEFDDPDDNEAWGVHAVYDSWGNVTSYQLNIEPRDYRNSFDTGAILGEEKTYLVIPKTAKYAKEAIQLLDLMRAPIGEPGNDLLNMLVYGFAEGSPEAEEAGVFHYTLNGDQIHSEEYIQQASSGSSYGQPHWYVGNVFLTYRTELIPEGMKEYALKYDTETRNTFPTIPTAGFVFNTKGLTAKIDSLNTVVAEFAGRIDWGIENEGTQALYEQYVAKLKQAGVQDLIDAYNQQYQAFKG